VGGGLSSFTLATIIGDTILVGTYGTAATPADGVNTYGAVVVSGDTRGGIWSATASSTTTVTITVGNGYTGGWGVDLPTSCSTGLAVATGYGSDPAYPSTLSVPSIAVISTTLASACATTGGAAWVYECASTGFGGYTTLIAQNVSAHAAPELSSNTTTIDFFWVELASYGLAAPPAQPSVSAIAVSNSEVDLIWNDSSALVGSDHATLNEYSGASCSGSGTAVDVQTGNWGFQNFTALTPATVYSFNVTITDLGGTSAASACAAVTTRAQTLDPFGAVAQGNTTISLPTTAGELIL